MTIDIFVSIDNGKNNLQTMLPTRWASSHTS